MTHEQSFKISKLVGIRYDQMLAVQKKPRGWFAIFVRAKLDEEAGLSDTEDQIKLSDMECMTKTQKEVVNSE